MTDESGGPIVVYGASGFGREVIEVLLDLNEDAGGRWDILGFVDDNAELVGSSVGAHRVLGDAEWLLGRTPRPFVAVGLGAPMLKRRVVTRLRYEGFVFPSLVHPSSRVGSRIQLREGVVITAGNILTCDVRIGSFVTINLGCTIGHDAVLDDFVTLAPGVHVSGGVRIEEGAEVGTGAVIIQNLTVGEWSVLGAGAVASRNVDPNSVAVGIPARSIKERPTGWQDE